MRQRLAIANPKAFPSGSGQGSEEDKVKDFIFQAETVLGLTGWVEQRNLAAVISHLEGPAFSAYRSHAQALLREHTLVTLKCLLDYLESRFGYAHHHPPCARKSVQRSKATTVRSFVDRFKANEIDPPFSEMALAEIVYKA